jgi:hypothetical protein
VVCNWDNKGVLKGVSPYEGEKALGNVTT